MKMTELLKLYHEFFQKLGETNESYPDQFEGATREEIDSLATEFNLFVPEDIADFWAASKTVYQISKFEDDEEWEAGFDFCDIETITRDIPMYRDELSQHYDDADPLKNLHLKGVPLSFSEPALIYDADNTTKSPGIYLMLWDGEASFEPIAPDFTTFFTHWLASGCFRGREFQKYWKSVESFVPIKIPHDENLWLKYYDKLYKDEFPIF